jgi:iron(III) transport system substrate-binding protein
MAKSFCSCAFVFLVLLAINLAPDATSAEKPAWMPDWERTVAEARKEGVVSVYTLWRPETRIALTAAFKDEFGINAELTPFGRGSEMVARVQTEKRAGMNLVDVMGSGVGTLLALKPEGLLAPIEPFLMLPEVTDANNWTGGRFPYLDKDKQLVGMIASLQRFIMYNTSMIKKGEITSYKDLLKPQYKGQITLNDPTVTGPGTQLMTHLSIHLGNLNDAKEYLKQLVKQQEAVIQRDHRLHVESVARGKFAIGVAPLPDILAQFMKEGAPVDVVIAKEGVNVTPAAGCFCMPVQVSHPNAAKVFVNWLLTREGQTIFARSFGNPSRRIDVSTEGFLSIFVPQAGEKLYWDDEEAMILFGKWLGIAKEVIEEATK